jgi:hypothetical protein
MRQQTALVALIASAVCADAQRRLEGLERWRPLGEPTTRLDEQAATVSRSRCPIG